MGETRGPIEKGDSGWPINPFGVAALVIFAVAAVFLIVLPIARQRKVSNDIINEQQNNPGGQLASPQAGEIIKGGRMTIELAPTDPSNVKKVQFWAKIYANNKWEMIGEATSAPFKLDWVIPDSFKNKSIAVTSHIETKDNQVIKDPGGWREGIIILSHDFFPK